MAAPEINENGISIQTFNEIFSEFSDGIKSIYGNDINVDQDSPDGQRLGIQAKLDSDLQILALSLYNGFDPDFAIGNELNRLIKLSGITRNAASQSSWDLSVSTDRPVTLISGYSVSDNLGQVWQVPSDTQIPTGSTSVTFLSQVFGQITGTAGVNITPVTIIPGVLGITAPTNATVGMNEETDPQLRIRRNRSLLNAAYSTPGSLFAKLANIEGVIDLQVYENDQDVTSPAPFLMPPHSIWAIVEGGTLEEIKNTIALNKTAGTDLKGAIEETYIETRTRPTGQTYQVSTVVRFDRPTITQLQVRFDATRTVSTDPINVTLLQQKVAESSFFIGQFVASSTIYDKAFEAGDNFILKRMRIRRLVGGTGYSQDGVQSNPDEKFVIDAANVVVNEIIP